MSRVVSRSWPVKNVFDSTGVLLEKVMVPFTELMMAKSLALGGLGFVVQLLPCWKSPPVDGPIQTAVTAIASSTATNVMNIKRHFHQPPNTLSLRRICELIRITMLPR